MSKKLKKQRKLALPYWPSAEFMRKALDEVKQKGAQGTDAELEEMIKWAYQNRRAQLLTEEKMREYEKT